MPVFDWVSFLDRHHIDYLTAGSSVVKGNVSTKCPWCGDNDPSYHLGINLHGKGYGCWRNQQHRGIRPHRLIRALTGCSQAEANRLVGEEGVAETIPDEAIADRITALFTPEVVQDYRTLKFTPEIKPLVDQGFGRKFIDYLVGRLYSRVQACDLADRYDLRYAYAGPFAYRIIVPVVMEGGLANWTGRAIAPSEVRYKTLTCDMERARSANLPPARLPIDACLFNFDELIHDRYDALIVTEGPFDALRLDYFGIPRGIRATCVFGTGNLSNDQIELLVRLRRRSKRRFLLFDKGAELEQLAKATSLAHLGFETLHCPHEASDPAMITEVALSHFFDDVLN